MKVDVFKEAQSEFSAFFLSLFVVLQYSRTLFRISMDAGHLIIGDLQIPHICFCIIGHLLILVTQFIAKNTLYDVYKIHFHLLL